MLLSAYYSSINSRTMLTPVSRQRLPAIAAHLRHRVLLKGTLDEALLAIRTFPFAREEPSTYRNLLMHRGCLNPVPKTRTTRSLLAHDAALLRAETES